MSNMNNDFASAFAKIASEKMEVLKEAFFAELEKVMRELDEHDKAMGEAQKKAEYAACPHEKCQCEESDEYKTVTLADDEFFEDELPSDLITICAKEVNDKTVVSIEYDECMGPNGAMSAFLAAFTHMMKHSMESSGIEVSFEACLEAVCKNFVNMAMDAALKI